MRHASATASREVLEAAANATALGGPPRWDFVKHLTELLGGKLGSPQPSQNGSVRSLGTRADLGA
ncbi:hypothetical protein [Demequina gelatinilytica]|uniref:hypothetical protein n=1 Tax=Demequina gelatinilytica TaxID=1638980 RepID=UPI000784EAF5|nr:hypothetical protein [Demequina gelatinilytica]